MAIKKKSNSRQHQQQKGKRIRSAKRGVSPPAKLPPLIEGLKASPSQREFLKKWKKHTITEQCKEYCKSCGNCGTVITWIKENYPKELEDKTYFCEYCVLAGKHKKLK